MSAPSATARGTPAGLKLKDGWSTLITFASNPTIKLWEITVQPPGIEMSGDGIDISTMHNDEWKTFAPTSLKKGSDGQFTFAFDPAVKTQIKDIAGVEDVVTYTYPDGTTEAFWGWLQSVNFSPHVEGSMPTGTGVVKQSNMDLAGVEQAPVIASVDGT